MTMRRPYPPAAMLELSELSHFGTRLAPAPEVWEWLQAEVLSDSDSIHNEDHCPSVGREHRWSVSVGIVVKQGL
jgi:hypothetical protein